MRKNVVIVLLSCLVVVLGVLLFVNYNGKDKCTNDKPFVLSFDKTKCINCDLKDVDVHRYGAKVYVGNNYNAVIDEENEKVVNIEMQGDLFVPVTSLTFDKKVSSIYDGYFDTNSLAKVFVFLFEDGTVGYIKLSDVENGIYNYEIISDVKDVIRFDTIGYTDKDYNYTITTIALKQDGTFYDLSKYIKGVDTKSNSELKTIDLDITKCINCTFKLDNQNVYDGSELIFDDASEIKISDDKRKVSFSIDYIGDGSFVSFDITFDKNVKEVFEGISHTFEIGGTVYFFLFEDGTVKYLDVSSIHNKNYTPVTVEGVSGVVELKNIYYEAKVNPAGGGTMVLALKQDGTFYNLYDSIKFN